MQRRRETAARGSARRPAPRRLARSACSGNAPSHCRPPRSATRRRMPESFTCIRSSDESTLRTVPPETVSSASTFHGSSAWRSSSSTHPLRSTRSSESETPCALKPLLLEVETPRAQMRQHFAEIALTKCGSMKRSCSSVPQRIRPPSNGCFQNVATSARISSDLQQAHAQMRSHLKRAQLQQPKRSPDPPAETSCRCRIPPGASCPSHPPADCETAVHNPRLAVALGQIAKRDSNSYSASVRASSTRGYWLVGPTYIPENRYESDGWFCQNATMLRSRSGRRSNGLSSTVAPPITIWLPPPVADARRRKLNFSAVSRLARASSNSTALNLFQLIQLLAGGRLISSTPGSGVTLKKRSRGSAAAHSPPPTPASADSWQYLPPPRPDRDSPPASTHKGRNTCSRPSRACTHSAGRISSVAVSAVLESGGSGSAPALGEKLRPPRGLRRQLHPVRKRRASYSYQLIRRNPRHRLRRNAKADRRIARPSAPAAPAAQTTSWLDHAAALRLPPPNRQNIPRRLRLRVRGCTPAADSPCSPAAAASAPALNFSASATPNP
jgi:hypothetical protein